MGAIRHDGGYRAQRGATTGVLFMADPGITTPAVEAVGPVGTSDGEYVQRFLVPEPTAGYVWYYGLATQPKLPLPANTDEVVLGRDDVAQEPCEFYMRRESPRSYSVPISVDLTYPGTPGERPVVIGTISPDAFDLGEAVSVATAVMFSGTVTTYSARFTDGNLTAGWSINSGTGVLTGPTGVVLDKFVIVRAENDFGGTDAPAFRVQVLADGLRVVTSATFTGATAAVGELWTITPPAMAGDGGSYTITYRFLRSGTAIGDFSATTTYTITVADQANAITAEYQVVGATQTEVFTATGLAAVPAAPITDPAVIGTIENVLLTPGQVTTRTASGVFSGTGAPVYSMAFSTGPLMDGDGFSINPTTGAIFYPNTAGIAEKTLVVRATYGALFAETTFTHRVRPAMTVTGATFTPAVAPGTAIGSVWNVAGSVVVDGTAPTATLRRFLRNGTAIGAFAAATSYTIVAADQGTTITAEVQATDASNPVQTATMTAVGSAVIPGGAANFTVNNTAELLAAMVTAAARTTPQLIIANAGDYAALTRGALVKQGFQTVGGERVNDNNRVTIRAQNPSVGAAAKTRFLNATMTLTGLSGFTWDGIVWERTTRDGVNYADTRMNSKFGGVAGFPTGDLASINACDNMTFVDCRCIGGLRGLRFTTQVSDRITFLRTEFLGFGVDACPFNGPTTQNTPGHSNILQDSCRFEGDIDYQRSQDDNPNRHPDSSSFQGHSYRNITITRNSYFYRQGYAQGPFVPNAPVRDGEQTFANGKNETIVIRLNYIESRHTNAYLVGACEGLDLSDNVSREVGINTATEVVGPGSSIPNINLNPLVNGSIARNVIRGNINFQNGANGAGITGINTNTIGANAGWPAAMNGGPLPCGPYSSGTAEPTHVIAPESGTHPVTFTSTTTGPAVTRTWFRNEAIQANTTATFASAAQQEGGLRCRATRVDGGFIDAFARIGRLQPTVVATSLISGITAAGGGAQTLTIPAAVLALDPTTDALACIIGVSYPKTGNTWPIPIATGFTQHSTQIDRFDTSITMNDYVIGVSKKVLNAADLTAGSFSQYVGFHGVATAYWLRDYDSLVGDLADHNRAQGLAVSSLPLALPATIETCTMLVMFSGSNYQVIHPTARILPAPVAGTSDYIRGPVNTTLPVGGRWHGHVMFHRYVGGGTPGAKTVTGAATGTPNTNEAQTTFTLRALGPA